MQNRSNASGLLVVTDFDGVLADTRNLALDTLKEVTSPYQDDVVISSFDDYARLIGKEPALKGVDKEIAEKLRRQYRKAFARRAPEITFFPGVMEIFKSLSEKPPIVSSTLQKAIRTSLGTYINVFGEVYGFEAGPKKDVLSSLNKQRRILYVTDRVIDIQRCRDVQVSVIGVGWGWDSMEKIKNSEPDFEVLTPMDLKQLFLHLELLNL